MMRLTQTAPMQLDAVRIAAIKELAKRGFEPTNSTTMVSCLLPTETHVEGRYTAVRGSGGTEAYKLQTRLDGAFKGGPGGPLPILIDGNTRKQVGAVFIDQDGEATAQFSRSENGKNARQAFATGSAALTVAYLQKRTGREAAAFSLRANGKASKMDEAKQIAAMGRQHGKTDLAAQAIEAGKTLEQFRNDLLDQVATAPLDMAAPVIHGNGERDYSLGAMLRASVTGDWSNAGYEREMSQEAARHYPGQARGLVVPAAAILGQRATMTSSANAAGAITSDLNAGMFIDKLRSASSVMAAGATVMTGFDRNFTVPKLAADATAAWLAEGAAVSDSSIDVDSISLSMKRVSASQTFTREALLQSTPSIDEIVRRSIGTTLMQAIDLAGLEGTGTNGQPTGVANTSGVNTLTAAGNTLTYAEALTALSAIEADNIGTDNAVFVMHPADYARIAQETVDAGSGRFVIDPATNTILGRRVIQTTKATESSVYLGVWEHLLIALFGGVDLIVDPYTEAKSAKIAITSHMLADVNVRHAQAFNVISLTTA